MFAKGLAAFLYFGSLALLAGRGPSDVTNAYPYRAVNIEETELRVFPFQGQPTKIQLPHRVLGAKSPNAKSIFGFAELSRSSHGYPEQQLAKIELGPTRITALSVPKPFSPAGDFAVSSDEELIVFFGKDYSTKPYECGLIEFNVLSGKARKIVSIPSCETRFSTWSGVAIAPDKTKVLAYHNLQLELIDLASGSSKALGRYSEGSWSPDGRWIVTVGDNNARVSIWDASTMNQRKLPLVSRRVTWSPDSRFLLHGNIGRCKYSDWDSLGLYDVSTGKDSIIVSSRCDITSGATFWLSASIAQ